MDKRTQKELDRIRKGIDGVDDQLVRQLAKRRGLVLRLARIKKQFGLPIYDRKREEALIARVKAWGISRDLNGEFVEVLFRLVVMNSKEVQYHETL